MSHKLISTAASKILALLLNWVLNAFNGGLMISPITCLNHLDWPNAFEENAFLQQKHNFSEILSKDFAQNKSMISVK